jgi:hypothetical protein
MSKVNFDLAKAEVDGWLDKKRIPSKKRESLSGMIDNLIDAVVEGDLTIDEETGIMTHTLVVPIGESEGYKELKYKLRITGKDVEPHKKLIKGSDFGDELTRIILALTGAPINVIRQLDMGTDRSIAEAIAVFFV